MHDMALQRRLVSFICWVLAGCIAGTLTMFFLQGFGKFHLSEAVLQWLGGATIGAIGGLALVVYKAMFK